jgi:hypothetical protein
MLHAIDPTHQQHRLQVEHIVFGDDAKHTSQQFPCIEESSVLSTILLRKLDIGFNQLQDLDSVAQTKIQAEFEELSNPYCARL